MPSRPKRRRGNRAATMQNLHMNHRYALPQRMAPSRRKIFFSPVHAGTESPNHNRSQSQSRSQSRSQSFKSPYYNVGNNQLYHPYPYQAYCNRANRSSKMDNFGDQQLQLQMPRKGEYNFGRAGEPCLRPRLYYTRAHARDCSLGGGIGDSKQWRSQSPYMLAPSNGSLDQSISNPNLVSQVKYPIVPLFFRPSDNLWTTASPKLNEAAVACTMKGATATHSARGIARTSNDMDFTLGRLVAKPTWRATPLAVGQHQPAPKNYQLNAAAPVFQPGLRGSQVSAQAPPPPGTALQGLNLTMSMGLDGVPGPMAQRHFGTRQSKRYNKQPLPDLFGSVMALMRDSSRSVSYPEIINTLALRLQRPEVELKRHVPHTLQFAVQNGYLSKQGNRYTLLSKMEHLEIMRRNKEAALRAKELEKEPLSWRKR